MVVLIWRHHRRKRRWSSSAALLLLWIASVNASLSGQHGLTTYGEACSDRCARRGFPYTWCHKRPSRNGTWIDRSVDKGFRRRKKLLLLTGAIN